MLAFKNTSFLTNVIIVGCGGTGSRLLPLVAQKLARGNYSSMIPTITLIDGDEVEVKNLTRQHFISQDVGLNKAQVLGERYGEAFGVPTITIPEFWEPTHNWLSQRIPETLNRVITTGYRVWFICVDNMQVRHDLIEHIISENRDRANPDLIIEAGNENTFGQTRVFHARQPEAYRETAEVVDMLSGRYLAPGTAPIQVPFIPAPLGFYKRLKDYKGEADVSCAELEQTGAVNNLMAASMFSIFQSMYDHQNVSVPDWYFDIHNGNHQTKMNAAWLTEIAEGGDYPVWGTTLMMGFWPRLRANIDLKIKKGELPELPPMMKALGL